MFQSEKTMTILMLLVPFVWALSGVSVKYLSFSISEDEVVVYRFFLSALSTFPLLIWFKIPLRISLKNLVICILLAFFLIGNYRTYFMGMQRGAVGLGAALVTVLIPIFVYILMIFSKKSKPILKDWLALVIGAIGVVLMLDLEQLNLDILVSGGNIYFVLAALTYALFTVFASYMRSIHVLTIHFYVCLFGLLIDWNLSYDSNHLSSLVNMDYVFWINMLFISVIAAMVQLVEMLMDRFSPALYVNLGIFLPLITVNCSILGTSLFLVERDYNLIESTVFGFGSGLGFFLAIVSLATVRKRMRYSNVPPTLRGVGMAMLLTGLISMAFLGFSGISL